MRLINPITFIFFTLGLLECNKEEVVSPFSSNVDVYIGGTTGPLGLPFIACYWKNGNLVTLTDGKLSAQGTSIAVSGTDIYVAGYQNKQENGATHVAKYWKNGGLVNLTDGNSDAEANSIAVSGSDVYVAGYENDQPSTIDGNPSGSPIAKFWKNGVPTVLGAGIALSIFINGNDVYVAGANSLGAVFWKNGVPTQIADGSWLNAIAVSGSDVYVAGYQGNGTFAGNGVTIAKLWKNGVATNLTNGTTFGTARGITISGSDVYVAGDELDISIPGTVKTSAKYWKNGSPVTLFDQISYYSSCYSVFPFGSDVYVTGNYRAEAVCWINNKEISLTPSSFGQGHSLIVVNK